jgi:hypothetical protein
MAVTVFVMVRFIQSTSVKNVRIREKNEISYLDFVGFSRMF